MDVGKCLRVAQFICQRACTTISDGPRGEELRFSPSFDPFLVVNQPLFKAFWDFPWAKTRHHGLKMGPNHLFEHPEWSRITFGKTRF